MSDFLRHGTWLAVCDGKKALLLRNQGGMQSPNLETSDVFKQDNPPAHLQGSAPPGRAFAASGRRSATEETDFHDLAEKNFVHDFARRLDLRVRSGDIHALVLIAPARSLGILRSALTDNVRKVVKAELDRDYVNMPLDEIERQLIRLS